MDLSLRRFDIYLPFFVERIIELWVRYLEVVKLVNADAVGSSYGAVYQTELFGCLISDNIFTWGRITNESAIDLDFGLSCREDERRITSSEAHGFTPNDFDMTLIIHINKAWFNRVQEIIIILVSVEGIVHQRVNNPNIAINHRDTVSTQSGIIIKHICILESQFGECHAY